MATKKRKKLINGKPMRHWQSEANRLVVEVLVAAASKLDVRSIVGELASNRLMDLAIAEAPELVREAMENKERFAEGVARALKAMSNA